MAILLALAGLIRAPYAPWSSDRAPSSVLRCSIALGVEVAGARLAQAPITYAFWFGWIDYHPESTVYGVER